jgi:DNA-binding ferritin-like protein
MKEDLILKLVQIQLQFKFLHWQTFGYSKHKAYGKIYDNLGDMIDMFAEAMMGKYGRPEFESEFSIMFQDIKTISVQDFLDGITEFLVSMTDQLDSRYDTDLLNLRDEMLAEINKLKYLLTLKS